MRRCVERSRTLPPSCLRVVLSLPPITSPAAASSSTSLHVTPPRHSPPPFASSSCTHAIIWQLAAIGHAL